MDSTKPPENRAPTMSKAPPAGKKFPCKACGARVDFDPSSRALACPYCGHKEDIAPDTKGIEERPFKAYLENRNAGAKPIEGRSSQTTCTACGAVVLLEDKVATDRCPYCSSALENKPETAENMLAPEGVLPFKIQQKEAVAAFEKWIASLWFAPGTLKSFANLGRLDGLYVPFWTFDSMTYSHYTGRRGVHYTVQETYTDSTGETKTRSVTRTDWTFVSGEVQHFFDDVLVCASKGVPDHYASKITTNELGSLEEFKPEFLAGFKTERYVIDPVEGWARAQKIMDGSIHAMCRSDIGGDVQEVHNVRTQHVGVTFKHVLLPVWMASYHYLDRTYRVLVNGRTGDVTGDRPYSVVKIVALVLTVLLAVGALVYLFT